VELLLAAKADPELKEELVANIITDAVNALFIEHIQLECITPLHYSQPVPDKQFKVYVFVQRATTSHAMHFVIILVHLLCEAT